jgi:hypothetical protein
MPAALDAADELDPHECRRACAERFAPERMIADYLAAYRVASERLERATAAPVAAASGG